MNGPPNHRLIRALQFVVLVALGLCVVAAVLLWKTAP